MHRNRLLLTCVTLLTLLALLIPSHVFAAPAAPSGLTATVSSATQVNLTWTDNSPDGPATTETGFQVERSTDGGATFTALAGMPLPANTTAFADNTVGAGNTYSYRVIALAAVGAGSTSNVATTTLAVPSAPSGLTAVVVGSVSWQVNLSWTDNSNNESSFTVERSSDSFANVTALPVPGGANRTSYSDATGVAATTYSYRVVAVNTLGPSAPASNVVSAVFSPPAAPSGLFTSLVSATQVNLGWADNSLIPSETGFRIERSTDGITFAAAGAVAANVITFNDTVPAASAFFYRVIAISLSGDSAPSNLTSVRATKPAAPTALTAALLGTRIDLTWTDNSDNEMSFRIERSVNNFATAPSASFITAANRASYNDTTITTPATYSYRVFAVNIVGDSTATAVASVIVPTSTVLTVGPIDPISIFQGNPNTGFPTYYQDDQGTRLSLLPITGNGVTAPTQIFDAADPANLYSVQLGFGTEAFYYDAVAKFNTATGRGTALMAVEAAFAPGNAVPQQEMVFTRTRFKIDVPVPGTYTIQYPYGTKTIDVTAADITNRGGIFFTEDIGLTPRDFLVAGTGSISRFLRQTVPPPPAGWIGDGVSIGPVTGSPTSFNAVRITGPVGVNLDGAGNNFIITNQFMVSGRTVTATLPGPNFSTALSPVTGITPVTATFTDTSTGTPTGWLWSFGDGTSSTLQNPGKTYNSAGNYTVTLTVTNPNGSASTSRTVRVYSAPVAAFTKTAPNGLPPVAINFTDTSTGNATSWVWDFGDGSSLSALRNPAHSYAAAGTYTIKLTVSNPAGASATSQTVSISSNLTANFTKSATSGVAPLTVNFTDTSTGTVTGRLWNFGDGTPTSTALNPGHIYTTAGNYTVTLTVTDAAGSAAASQTVSVFGTLTASFTRIPAFGPPPLTVNFTDTSAGNPTSWAWTFGDGTTSAVQNPSKTYAMFGTYTVSLTVTNAAGTASASQPTVVSTIDPAALKLLAGPIFPASIFQGNPNTGFPTYYQDDQGTRLSLLPITGNGVTAPTQIFDAADPANPYSVQLGFGTEAFYYDAVATFNTATGRGTALMAVEAAFTAGNAVPQQEMVFTRTRFKIDVPVPGTYTIQYPYGTKTIDVTAADIANRGGIFFTEDIGLTPRDFLVAGTGSISRFLRQTPTVAIPVPFGWIGDGVTAGPVTGGPLRNNVIITGPFGSNLDGAGNNFIMITDFTVAGRIASPLTPSFTMTLNPANGAAPCVVTFTDTTTGGAVTSRVWDFGDGTTPFTAPTAVTTHTYNTAGNYPVKLTVTDALAGISTTQTVSIFSTPVATFTSTLNGTTPLTINFTDTSTGIPTGWSWNFGDGATSTVQNPVHTYAVAGNYTVSLTVNNTAGSASTSQTVAVFLPGIPAAPSGLTATTVKVAEVRLRWTDNANNETGFLIERSASADTGFVIIGTLGINATEFTDLSVSAATSYFYEVFATNANGATVNLGGPLSVTTPALPVAGGGGGGGGGGIVTPPQPVTLTGLTSAAPPNINASGVATTTGTVATIKGDVNLTVPAGTKLQTGAGAPVSTLTATPLVTPAAPPPRGALVVAYSFGPSGAQFNPPLSLSMTFTPAQVPAGTPLNKLVVAYWDGKAWIKLPSVLDPATNTVTAQVSHFTDFALIHDPDDIEPTPSPTPSTIVTAPSPAPTPKPVVTETPPVVTPTASTILTEPPKDTMPAPVPVTPTGQDNTWPLIGIGMATLVCGALMFLLVGRKPKRR